MPPKEKEKNQADPTLTGPYNLEPYRSKDRIKGADEIKLPDSPETTDENTSTEIKGVPEMSWHDILAEGEADTG